MATYGKGSTFDQRLAKGFVELWGLQSTEANKLQKKR
jgi:argininosuccinate synthase